MSYYGSSQPSDKLTGLGLPGGQTKPRHQRADGGVRSTMYNSLVGNNRECSNSILPSVFFAGTHQSGSSRRDSAFARIIQRQHDRKSLMGEVLGQLVMRAQLTPKYSERGTPHLGQKLNYAAATCRVSDISPYGPKSRNHYPVPETGKKVRTHHSHYSISPRWCPIPAFTIQAGKGKSGSPKKTFFVLLFSLFSFRY